LRTLADLSRKRLHTKFAERGRYESESSHYSYEDEDQSADSSESASDSGKKKGGYTGPAHNSIGNIAEFFASRGKKFSVPKMTEPRAG